jgi:hypothetical protein
MSWGMVVERWKALDVEKMRRERKKKKTKLKSRRYPPNSSEGLENIPTNQPH